MWQCGNVEALATSSLETEVEGTEFARVGQCWRRGKLLNEPFFCMHIYRLNLTYRHT
jgi:hypothetical protein